MSTDATSEFSGMQFDEIIGKLIEQYGNPLEMVTVIKFEQGTTTVGMPQDMRLVANLLLAGLSSVEAQLGPEEPVCLH